VKGEPAEEADLARTGPVVVAIARNGAMVRVEFAVAPLEQGAKCYPVRVGLAPDDPTMAMVRSLDGAEAVFTGIVVDGPAAPGADSAFERHDKAALRSARRGRVGRALRACGIGLKTNNGPRGRRVPAEGFTHPLIPPTPPPSPSAPSPPLLAGVVHEGGAPRSKCASIFPIGAAT